MEGFQIENPEEVELLKQGPGGPNNPEQWARWYWTKAKAVLRTHTKETLGDALAGDLPWDPETANKVVKIIRAYPDYDEVENAWLEKFDRMLLPNPR